MANNYQSSGLDAVFTATKDYQSGDLVKIGNLLGVAHDDVAASEQGVAIIEGVFELPKAAGVAFSQGAIAGYKSATGLIQTIEMAEDGDLTGAGVVVQDADAADETVMLKINTGVGGSGGGKAPVPDGGLTVTVGSGGDYETLGAAIDWVTGTYRPSVDLQDSVVINLLSGSVISEQLRFADGNDYSWIEITAIDASVVVDASGFTRTIDVWGEAVRPFIAAENGTKAPEINFSFDFGTSALDYLNMVSCFYAADYSSIKAGDISVSNCSGGAAYVVGSSALSVGSGAVFDNVASEDTYVPIFLVANASRLMAGGMTISNTGLNFSYSVVNSYSNCYVDISSASLHGGGGGYSTGVNLSEGTQAYGVSLAITGADSGLTVASGAYFAAQNLTVTGDGSRSSVESGGVLYAKGMTVNQIQIDDGAQLISDGDTLDVIDGAFASVTPNAVTQSGIWFN